jgi:electron transfer flavoprotein beta subunit
MAAKKKPLETWSLGDLGVDAAQVGLAVAWTQVEETTARPPRTAGEIVKDEDGSGATALAGFLASKKFICGADRCLKFSFSSTSSTAQCASRRTSS